MIFKIFNITGIESGEVLKISTCIISQISLTKNSTHWYSTSSLFFPLTKLRDAGYWVLATDQK